MAESLPALEERIFRPRSFAPVIQGGLATTVITLVTIFLLNRGGYDFNPLGFYLDYLFPVGAIAVGLFAGSGYGIMLWWLGLRAGRNILITILLLQTAAYVAAEYLEYFDLKERITKLADEQGLELIPPGFIRYYMLKAENFTWKADSHGSEGSPLGAGGYFFVGLAAIGFIGGSVIAPGICRALPYCEDCERYMKTKNLGWIAASEPKRKKDADLNAKEFAADAAQEHVKQLLQYAEAGDVSAFRDRAKNAFGTPKPTKKLAVRVATDLVQCGGCERGWIRLTLHKGHGKTEKKEPIGRVVVSADFARNALSPLGEMNA